MELTLVPLIAMSADLLQLFMCVSVIKIEQDIVIYLDRCINIKHIL